MSDDKIRVGVVGLGIGDWHVGAFQGDPGSRVTAICDTDDAKLAAVGDKHGVATRLKDWGDLVTRSDVDAVSICLPNYLHKPVAVAALEAGKHVLTEKPLALSPEEGEEIRAAAARAGRVAMVAMKLRYGANSIYAHDLIASGRIGRPYYGRNSLVLSYSGGLPNRPWFSRRKTGGGGALFDNGVHFLDLHWYIVGRPKPTEVMAVCYSEFGPRGKGMAPECAEGFDVEDFGVGIVRFADGSAITVENAWLAHIDTPIMQLRVFASEGGLSLFPLTVVVEKDGKDEVLPVDLTEAQAKEEGQFAHFLRCIRTGATPCSSIEDGITMLRVLCAMYESARTGRSVSL